MSWTLDSPVKIVKLLRYRDLSIYACNSFFYMQIIFIQTIDINIHVGYYLFNKSFEQKRKVLIMTKKMQKLIVAGMAAIFAVAVMAGCGSDSAQKQGPAKSNKLVVGLNPTYEPFEFQGNDGKVQGFDVDIINAVAKKMGKEVEFKSMPFDTLIPALQTKELDVIDSGMIITKARSEKVAFLSPHFQTDLSIVTKDNTITTPQALEGKKIAVQMGTAPADIARKINGAQVTEYDHGSYALLALKNNQADAVIIDMAVAKHYTIIHPEDKFEIFKYPNTGTYIAMSVHKENNELKAAMNKAIAEIKADGTLDKIYQKWFQMNAPKDLPLEFTGK